MSHLTPTAAMRSAALAGAAACVLILGVGAAPAAAIDRFARCSPDAEPSGLTAPATRLDEPAFSDREVEVQALALDIEDAFRASSARKDYFGMGFDHDPTRVNVYVRNRKHDRAIHFCARQLGIDSYVRITVHRWSKGQLLGAIKKTIRATDDLYDAGLFECSYGAADRFNVEVYAEATDAQVARIRKAAKATKVAFRLERLKTSRPKGELL